MNKKKRVMVGSIGNCVHSLGVELFADYMEGKNLGYVAVKLGPAVSIQDCINKIREARPSVVAISSRLGDLHVDKLITEFMDKALEHGIDPKTSKIRYCFGGLRSAANLVRAMTGQEILEDKFSPTEGRHFDLEKIAKQYSKNLEYKNFFELIVDDYITMEELDRFAEGTEAISATQMKWSDDLKLRIKEVRERENRAILRAHIGIASDSIQPTIKAIHKTCDSCALEIVSIAPDQPSQAFLAKFIRGEEDPSKYLKGQGGVPIRTKEDLKKLKEATLRGNFPTIRIYSGTDELLELAKIFEEAFNMPFAAVPIFFYNKLDGRGPIAIEDSFREHMEVIRWWASINKPLEINDPHQWQLRNSSDEMYVTDHVLCGALAFKCGIKDYIMQLMFDLPPEISQKCDLAKMKAAYELIEPITRHFNFNIMKETRGGLSSFPPNLNMAKGHLADSTRTQLYMDPNIIHVVSYSEAHHEAKEEDIIESCEIVKQVIKNFNRYEQFDPFNDLKLIARKEEIMIGAMYNIFHFVLLGGYEGKINHENFFDYAISPEKAAKRELITHRAKNYETILLDFLDDSNYPNNLSAFINPDAMDLALQTGLFQAPQVTIIDRRYEVVGACKTKILNGGCVIDEFMGKKVKDEIKRVDMVRKRAPWYFDKSISIADEEVITEKVESKISEQKVLEFREEVGIKNFKDKKVLVVDFGSTFTKIGIFDTKTYDFSLSYVPTTPDDIRFGLANGLGVLSECEKGGNWKALEREMSKFDIRLPCSSAKGGLKMITVGLVSEESAKAAELAALKAGAKLLASYSGKLTKKEIDKIFQLDCPEIILLAGGVNNGGDIETVLHNAKMLAKGSKLQKYAKYGVSVVYAGNHDVAGRIEEIFKRDRIDIRITENVMPEVNYFNIDAVNETIRDLFQSTIIRGKGFDIVEKYFDAPFIPTPMACLLGINLLAKGYGDEPGLGNIMALDIGGCTTDFYCNVNSNPLFIYNGADETKQNKRTILKTPNMPLTYRRVEGKYGLSYSAANLMDLERFKSGKIEDELDEFISKIAKDFPEGQEQLSEFIKNNNHFDLEKYLRWISDHPHRLPQGHFETSVNSFLAREIMRIATENNLGYVNETETYFMQYGVNLYSMDCTAIFIGGTIYHKCKENDPSHIKDLSLIATGALYNNEEPNILRPKGRVLMDADYLISILGGLYGGLDPIRALKVMKNKLKTLEI